MNAGQNPSHSDTASIEWWREFPAAVTICDPRGIIVAMNEKAAATFRDSGGMALVGSNLFDCHPEPARTRLRNMLQEQAPNVYTIEKNGRKKMIYQSPWYTGGVYAGFVEISFEIPSALPHFVRQ